MPRVSPILSLLAVALTSAAWAAEPFRVVEAKPAPELDALFADQQGWIGADGNYSLSISPERALWFYSDTWVGEIRGGKRHKPVMVNNSVGVMSRAAGETVDQSKLQFFYGEHDGKPAALWTAADGRGWFWLFAPTLDAGRLQVFLWQMEKAPGDGAFGFKPAGVSLGEVANPDDPPNRWKLEQRKLPFTEMSDRERIMFGSAVLQHEGQVYVYGISENLTARPATKRMVLARVAEGRLREFSAWEFRSQGKWQGDFRQAEGLLTGVASEYSVTWLPALGKFVAVYHDDFLSPNIVARTAPAPWGPWSEKATLYRCEEPTWKKGVFCYSGKAHPWLAGDDTLVVTYAANSGNLGDVINDARLYVPRFVRVKVAP